MMFENCIVCRDKNKFMSKVSDAKRILYRLELLFGKYQDIETEIDERETSRIYHLMPNFNPKCGNCHKINTMELRNVEKKLAYVVVKLKNILENEEILKEDRVCLKHQTNELLRGFYISLSKYILNTRI